jgi:photosystem II stability/assembly factor-like uncharacterized protein
MNKILKSLITINFLFLICTSNLSAQWTKLPIFQNYFFTEVLFWDINNGWITEASYLGTGNVYNSGVRVLHTSNGGNSWVVDSLPNASGSVNRDICFVDLNNGFISGDDGVWKTTNSGKTWVDVSPKNRIYFAGSTSGTAWFKDKNNGIYVWSNYSDTSRPIHFYRTTNGGATWIDNKQIGYSDLRMGASYYYNGVYYVTGGIGQIWISKDDGKTFSFSNTGNFGFQEDMYVSLDKILIASIDDQGIFPQKGKITISKNFGNTWKFIDFPGWMWGVTMYSNLEGWVCGDGGKTYRTLDGGETWKSRNCGMDTVDRVDDIYFVDSKNGWAVGDGIYKFDEDSKITYTRPDTLDFGAYLLNVQSPDFFAKIISIGGNSLVTNRTITGPDANMFTTTADLNQSQAITACEFANTPVKFKPISYGRKYAKLEYFIQGVSPNPFVILTGIAEKPTILSANNLTLNAAVCNGGSFTYFTFQNGGQVPLTIDTVYFENEIGGTFRVSLSTGYLTINVQLTSNLNATADLIIKSNDSSNSIVRVKVKVGTGSIDYKFDATIKDTLTLPQVKVGIPTTGCITFKNIGDQIQSVNFGIGQDGLDSLTQFPYAPFNMSILKDSLMNICFKGIARDTGWNYRRFWFRLQPCNRDTNIYVRFYATSPLFALPYKSSIDFLGIACGDSTRIDTLIVGNEGNEELVINKIDVLGADSSQFELLYPTLFPYKIPIKSKDKFIVKFKPTLFNGRRIAELLVNSNDALPFRNPWKIPVSGSKGNSAIRLFPKVNNIGNVCVRSNSLVQVLINNIGTVDGRMVSSVRLYNDNSVQIVREPKNLNIQSGQLDSLLFNCYPTKLGPFEEKFIVKYEPCSLFDTVIIKGNAIGANVVLSQSIIDKGKLSIKTVYRDSVVISNDGDIPVTINNAYFEPTTIYAALGTALPFVLLPKEKKTFLITIYLSDSSSNINSELKFTLKSILCDDTLSFKFKASTFIGVNVNSTGVSFGSVYPCDSSKIDSLPIIHKGGNSTNIMNIYLSQGANSKFIILNNFNFPISFKNGDQINIILGLKGSFTGSAQDSVILELDDPITKRLSYSISGIGVKVKLDYLKSDKTLLDSIDIILNRCDNTGEKIIYLKNDGQVYDTVNLTSSLPGVFVVQPTNIVLAPGEEVGIKIKALLNSPLEFYSKIIGINPTFTPVNLGTLTKGFALIKNNSKTVQVVDSIILTKPGFSFSLPNNYKGKVLNPNDTIMFEVNFIPQIVGLNSCTAIIYFNGNCNDTLNLNLNGEGLKPDDKFIVSLVPPSLVFGRWGVVSSIPFSLRNPQNGEIHSLKVNIKTDINLMNPLKVVPLINGLTISNEVYNSKTGMFIFEINSSNFLPNNVSFIEVQFDILR